MLLPISEVSARMSACCLGCTRFGTTASSAGRKIKQNAEKTYSTTPPAPLSTSFYTVASICVLMSTFLNLMSPYIALKSPLKLPSQPLPDVVMAQTRITAQKILQISHMELLQEGARPEPRLHRLLGHITTYENASQWCLENRREGIFCIGDKQEKAGDKRATTNDNSRDTLSSKLPTQVQCFRNLLEFQVATQSQLQDRTLVTVNAIEVDADSDDSDSSDSDSGDSSDESYESDSHDNDDHHGGDNDPRVYSHNSNAGTKWSTWPTPFR